MPKRIIRTVADTIETVDDTVSEITKKTGTVIEPVRASVFKRFPVLFILLTTLGVSATFLGFERVMLKHGYLSEHPLIMLGMGIIILIATGTLYRKLG